MDTECHSGDTEFVFEAWYKVYKGISIQFWKGYYVETAVLIVLIVYCSKYWLFISRRKKDSVQLEAKLAQKLKEWEPEPLVGDLSEEEKFFLENIPVVDCPISEGRAILLANGKEVIDMCSFNYCGLVRGRERITEEAIKCLRKCGVGTCGPRGFYGTTEVHLELENMLKSVFDAEAAILYSQTLSAYTSVINALCRRIDYVIADEAISFGLQKGITLSTKKFKFFKHNDMEDLEAALGTILKSARKLKSRILVVVEGLYVNEGDICPLNRIVEIRKKNDFILIVDDSHSVGVLGEKGLGILEYCNLVCNDVDILIGSFVNSFASSGGYCVGKKTIIEYQRLNGQSYTFSASSPAMLMVAASEGINELLNNPMIVQNLRRNLKYMQKLLTPLRSIVEISECVYSPLIHIRIPNTKPTKESISSSNSILQKIYLNCIEQGLLVAMPKYLQDQEINPKIPSIRIALSAAHTKSDILTASQIISKSVKTYIT